jgi:hypothetical protein
MTLLDFIGLGAACAAMSAPASAQIEIDPGDTPGHATHWIAQAGPHEMHGFDGPSARTMAFIADEIGSERVVKGAPYCADALHESVQPLADGNRIVQRQVTRLCRDGEGRTRQEVDYDGRKRVYLRDPVAREAWMLDPERRTARRLAGAAARGPLVMPDPPDGGLAWREYGERMREWGRALGNRMRTHPGDTPPPPPSPPALPSTATLPGGPAMSAQPVVIVSGEPARGFAQAGDVPGPHVQVLRVDGRRDEPPGTVPPLPPMPDMPALPPMVAHRLPGLLPRGPGVLSPLGSKDIEGVRVDGERTTWTIEAGRLGNEKPIVITREVWTSPDLLLTVQSREFDPRSGEITYRLSKLKRGEPDPALMKVPADYDAGRAGTRPAPPPASGRG